MAQGAFECRPAPGPDGRETVLAPADYVLEFVAPGRLVIGVASGRQAGPGEVQHGRQRVDLG